MNTDDLNPDNLKPTLGDVLHKSVKAGLGATPFIGSALSEIFGFGIDAPLEKRRNRFIIALKEKVDYLENNGQINKEELIADDAFLDVVIQAYEMALKYSQEEKINALQNAILNSALKIDISQDEKSMFLTIIDDLTPIDMTVLYLWYSPDEIISKLVNGRHLLLSKNIPDASLGITIPDDFSNYLKIDPNLFAIILNNLETRGLLQNTKNKHSTGISANNVDQIIPHLLSTVNERTTSFGRKFLQFINDPQIPPSET